MELGDYQTIGTPGFIFGAVVGPLLVILGVALVLLKGRKGNEAYTFAPASRFPKVVLLWRIVVLAYALVAASMMNEPIDLGYFTIWNWLLILLYFFLGIWVSVARIFALENPVYDQPKNRIRYLFLAHHVIGEIELPCSFFVLLVVWAYLAPTAGFSLFLTFSSVSEHILNAVFMSIDFFLAGWLMNPWHFPLVLSFAALYVCWHLIANAAWGMMAYPFMATNDIAYIYWIIGLSVVLVLFYFVFFGFSVLKSKYLTPVRPEYEGDSADMKEEFSHPVNPAVSDDKSSDVSALV